MMVKDISYKKLQLAILEGEVDFTAMNIFEESKIHVTKLGIDIHAAIIGTSHFVQIRKKDGNRLTEIFACDAIDNKGAKPLCFLPISQIDSMVKIESNLKYQFSYKFKSYQASFEEVSAWAKNERANNKQMFLEHKFDVDLGNAISSRTLLSLETNNEGVRIQTVHEYQEEDAIILSDSLMKF